MFVGTSVKLISFNVTAPWAMSALERILSAGGDPTYAIM
jgi:hypothetical protein